MNEPEKDYCYSCQELNVDIYTMYCDPCFEELKKDRKNRVHNFLIQGATLPQALQAVAEQDEIEAEDVL